MEGKLTALLIEVCKEDREERDGGREGGREGGRGREGEEGREIETGNRRCHVHCNYIRSV